MNCDEVIRFLMVYLDSDLDVKTDCEILEHLENCPDCERRYACEGRLERHLKEAIGLRWPDAALWERVLSPAVRASARTARLLLVRRVSAGMAACLLVAMGFFLVARFHPAEPSRLIFSRELERIHQMIAEGRESIRPLDSLPAGVDGYFKSQMGVAIDAPFNSDFQLNPHGVRINSFGEVPLGVIFASSGKTPVTFFIIRRSDLGRIPGLSEWLGDFVDLKEGELERYHFAIAAREPDVLVCAVSELPCKHLAHYLASQ